VFRTHDFPLKLAAFDHQTSNPAGVIKLLLCVVIIFAGLVWQSQNSAAPNGFDTPLFSPIRAENLMGAFVSCYYSYSGGENVRRFLA
jgi:hypothetical protein